MAAMNPSPTKPIVRYPTALLEDKELVTLHDTRLPDYKAFEYGTLFPDQTKYPGLKLVFQEPLGEDDRMVRRVWAGERADQDLYNSDRKYSGGSMEHPIIIRRYLFPEDGYTPLPSGTNDSQFPDAVLVDEEVTRPENRNGFLAVTRVFETIPGPLLTGILVTEKGQSATITTQTVAPGTVVTPSALTLSASVKPDGKGKSVLEKVEVTEVFSEKSFAIENPDPVPQKFRIAAPSTTTEETVEGTAAQPVLATGELAASEQQVTKFTKRVRKTARSTTALPVTLTGAKLIADFGGVIADVEETLGTDSTPESGFDVLESTVEAIGDGTFIKTVAKTGAFPVLHGSQVDSRFGVNVDYTREVVDASTAISGSVSSGVSVEIEPKDQWRSWKTQSSLSLPPDQMWYGVKRENLPDVLVGLSVSGQERWYAEPEWRSAPEGPMVARFTRRFSFGPPTSQPSITPISPQVFTFTVEYEQTSKSRSKNISNSSNANVSLSAQASSNSSVNSGSGSGASTNSGVSRSVSSGSSSSANSSLSDSFSASSTSSAGTSTNDSEGTSESESTTHSEGSSEGSSEGESYGTNGSDNWSDDRTTVSDDGAPTTADDTTWRASSGTSNSETHSTSENTSTNQSTSDSISESSGSSKSHTDSGFSSSGESKSDNASNSAASSLGTSIQGSSGANDSVGLSSSKSLGVGTSVSTGNSSGKSTSLSSSVSKSASETIQLTPFTLNLPKCLRGSLSVSLPDGGSFNIPATTPSNLPWGGWLEVSRQSEHWKLGIWVTEITEVNLPI